MSPELEELIARWRASLSAEPSLPAEDAQELEDHVRDEAEALAALGLSSEEAMLIALRRLGDVRPLVEGLAKIDADRAWRQMFVAPPEEPGRQKRLSRETSLVIAACLAVALLGKLPRLFGVELFGPGAELYLRNLSLFVVPVLIAAYWIHRRFSFRMLAWLAVVIAAAAVGANAYPFHPGGATSFLSALHLPLLLWLLLGIAYSGDEWRTLRVPLDFLRFTGEAIIYGVLILCGGAVFLGLTMAFFWAIGLSLEEWLLEFVGLSGLLATPVVAAYLVEKKRSLIENLAPVLARIFIPLFLVMLIAFISTVMVQGLGPLQSRDILILIDLLLVLVTGMVVYDLSARRTDEIGFGWSHRINLALIVAAIVVDCLALWGIGLRLITYGLSANKTAALGENILLLVNLAGLAMVYRRVANGRARYDQLLAWQVRYLPVYFAWFALVVFAFPPLFGYR